MAVKNYSVIKLGQSIAAIAWIGLANGDTGAPYDCPGKKDKSVQVKGTFGVGGECTVQGSNMETTPTYATLNDPQGNALTITTAKLEQVLENTLKIRPNITGGDGSTSLDVYLLVA